MQVTQNVSQEARKSLDSKDSQRIVTPEEHHGRALTQGARQVNRNVLPGENFH